MMMTLASFFEQERKAVTLPDHGADFLYLFPIASLYFIPPIAYLTFPPPFLPNDYVEACINDNSILLSGDTSPNITIF